MRRFGVGLLCLLPAFAPPPPDAAASVQAKGTSPVCATLEARGVISVRCHGAVGDGASDATDAIERAIAAARPDKIVLIPPGKYLVSRPLDVGGVHVAGLGFESAIVVATGLSKPLPAVLRSTNASTTLEGLVINAAQQAEIGLHIADAAKVQVQRVLATGAVGPGMFLERVRNGRMVSVAQSHNAIGLRIVDSSSVELFDLAASENDGDAIVVDGDSPGVEGAHETFGGVTLIHAEVEQNRGNAVTLRNLKRPSLLSYLWVENPGDGVRLENVHGAVVRYTRAVGAAGPNRAFSLTRGSSDNLLEANAANHAANTREAYLTWYAHSNAVHVADDCADNRIFGNLLDSGRLRLPLVIDGGARTRRATGAVTYTAGGDLRGGITQRTAPPEDPSWRVGDLILNPRPQKRAALGWLCVGRGARGCKWQALHDDAFGALTRATLSR